MSTTESSTDTAPSEGVPLTRRQLREMEARKAEEAARAEAEAEEAVVEESPAAYEPPRTMVSDTGLPSLFGDDEEEEVVEEVVQPAVYAREAPAGKYLAETEIKRIPMLPAPSPESVINTPRRPVASVPRSFVPATPVIYERKYEWTRNQKLKVVGFSLLVPAMYVVACVVMAFDLVAQLS